MGCRFAHTFLLSVLAVVACVTQIAAAAIAPSPALPKSFAVFVAAYNEKGEIRGGVAGTAFFISPRRAVTAYHVLQPKSFQLQPGFTRQRVWLVHEGEAPIELKQKQARFDSQNDLTVVDLDQDVSRDFIYQMGASLTTGAALETEGFRANTAGPKLARIGDEIEIVDVPRLERVQLTGQLMNQARVEIRAIDVTLNSTPCLQVNFEPIRGISGGPLLSGGKVVGINSFGDPREAHRTWAVAVEMISPN